MNKIIRRNIISSINKISKETISCFIKISNNFDIYDNMDIDLYCLDFNKVISIIFKAFSGTITNKSFLKVNKISENQVQVDIYDEGVFVFKFDLFNDLPELKRVSFRSSFFGEVIGSRIVKEIELSEGEIIKIHVPSMIDNLIIRYIEYVEYFEIRPDKIKHIDYILKNLNGDINESLFFEKLHFYIYLKDVELKKKKNNIFFKVTELYNKSKNYTLKQIIIKMFRKAVHR